MHSSQARTAFVLAGGGSLGAVEVGMLHAHTEHRLRPDFVVGASAGAINGAYFASDPTPRGVAKIDQLWRGLIRRHVMPMRLSDLFRIALRRDHLVNPCGLRSKNTCRTGCLRSRRFEWRSSAEPVFLSRLAEKPKPSL